MALLVPLLVRLGARSAAFDTSDGSSPNSSRTGFPDGASALYAAYACFCAWSAVARNRSSWTSCSVIAAIHALRSIDPPTRRVITIAASSPTAACWRRRSTMLANPVGEVRLVRVAGDARCGVERRPSDRSRRRSPRSDAACRPRRGSRSVPRAATSASRAAASVAPVTRPSRSSMVPRRSLTARSVALRVSRIELLRRGRVALAAP